MSNLLDDFSNIVSREEDAKKRKRIGKACVYCNRSHMSCEEARPCHRCVERGIAHLCRDIETNRRRGRKAGYLIDDMPKVDLLAEDIPKVKPPRADSTPSSSAILPPNTVIPKSVKSDSITIEERMKSLDANIMTIEANNTIGMHIDQNVLSDLSSDIEHLPEDLKMLLNDFFANSVTSDRYLNQAIIEPQHSFLEPGDVLARNLGNILKTRLPDDAQRLGKLYSELMTNMSKHFLELYPHFTPEMFKQVTSLEGVQHEIETQVAKFKQMFDSLPTPIIVFDRNGCVHYVNTAYKSLTGFGLPLPTGRFDYTFYSVNIRRFSIPNMKKHILSPASFKEFMEYMVNVLSDWPDKVSDNGYLMNCSLRFHNESRESFIEGTMSVCLLRDKFGIPYLNLGTFLPMLAKSIVVTANNRFVLRDTPSENSAKPSSV